MPEAHPIWWTEAVGDFAASMGFGDTSNWPASALNLSVDNGRYLVSLERHGDELLLAVFRRVTLRQVEDTVTLLLRACSHESHQPFFVQPGLKGEDTIVLAARLDRFEARRLFDAFELIRKLYSDTGL